MEKKTEDEVICLVVKWVRFRVFRKDVFSQKKEHRGNDNHAFLSTNFWRRKIAELRRFDQENEQQRLQAEKGRTIMMLLPEQCLEAGEAQEKRLCISSKQTLKIKWVEVCLFHYLQRGELKRRGRKEEEEKRLFILWEAAELDVLL